MCQSHDVDPNTMKLSLMTKEFLKQSTTDWVTLTKVIEDPLVNNISKQVADNIDN